ncbi:hypothetical protein Tco_0036356, partial [Tanacetum coccineum]
KAGNQFPTLSFESSPAIVLDDSCRLEKDLSCSLIGKIKDINALPNIYVIFANEGFEHINLTYLGGFWVLIDSDSISSKEKISKHVGVASLFNELLPASNTFVKVEADDNLSLPYKKLCVITRPNVIINDKIKVIFKGQVYWIRVKELDAWTPEFSNDLNDNSSSDGEFEDDEVEPTRGKKGDKEVSKGDDPIFPPGFTPDVVEETVLDNNVGNTNQSHVNLHGSNGGSSSVKSRSIRVSKLKPGGSILEVM